MLKSPASLKTFAPVAAAALLSLHCAYAPAGRAQEQEAYQRPRRVSPTPTPAPPADPPRRETPERTPAAQPQTPDADESSAGADELPVWLL